MYKGKGCKGCTNHEYCKNEIELLKIEVEELKKEVAILEKYYYGEGDGGCMRLLN